MLRLLSNQNFNPTRLIVVSFGAIILLGTFSAPPAYLRPGRAVHPLADLPVHRHLRHLRHRSGPGGQRALLDSLRSGGDPGHDPAGRAGICLIDQPDPLLLRRRIGLSQRLAIASAFNLNGMSGVVRVVRHALMGTFLLEGCGAILLATRFVPLFGWGRGLWYSIFHSVSAFCNADST